MKNRTPKAAQSGRCYYINPLEGLNLYDITGPRCLDCIYCGARFDATQTLECRFDPPTAKGWPKLPANIDRCFCSRFTSAELVQPLNSATRNVPKRKHIGQL